MYQIFAFAIFDKNELLQALTHLENITKSL
jgi:hypothetical protein